MKKILITHVSNTLNYGSAMMAINLIYYLNKKSSEQIEFYCDVDDYHLNRLKEETGLDNIYAYSNIPSNWKSFSKFKKAISIIRRNLSYIQAVVNKFDEMIVLGGDDFSEYYNVKFYITLHKLFLIKQLNSIAKKIPLVLYGQTIGPYTSWRKKIVNYLFKPMNVITRDSINYKYLKQNFSFNKIKDSRDLTFFDLPKQNMRHSVLKKFNLVSDKYVCIVISGLQYQYCESEETYIKNWEMIINEVTQKYPNFKVVLLSHVFCKGSSDSTMIEKITNTDKIIKITDILLPSEARTILGNGHLTITGRMHAAVSTFQCGKPAISLSYGVKYKGVISDGLKMSKLVIEKNTKMWNDFQVCKLITEKVEFIEKNYNDLIIEINKNVNSSKLIIEKSLLSLGKDS